MLSWYTDALISNVRILATALSDASTVPSDGTILGLLDNNIQAIMSPTVAKLREMYYELKQPFTLDANNSARIPYRAYAGTVNSVVLYAQPGGNYEYLVPRVDFANPQARPFYEGSSVEYPVFYLRNSTVHMTPPPNQTTGFMTFYAAPNNLVLTAQTATVTDITGLVVTMSQAVPGLSTGVQFDVIDPNPPFGLKLYDQVGTVTTNTITMTEIPEGLDVGDVISLAGTSPLAQLPIPLLVALKYKTAANVCTIIGDVNTSMELTALAQESLQRTIADMSPRTANHPKFILGANTPWFGRYGRRRGGGGTLIGG